MIRWVFLDVGNILLDEDPLTYLVFRLHVEAVRRRRPELTFLDLLTARETRAAAGSRWPLHDVVSEILGDAGCSEVWIEAEEEVRTRFDEVSPLIPWAMETVESLSRRYHLGLIANQGPHCRPRLKSVGILDYFDVVAFSEECGAAKPHPGLFRWAIGECGAEPSRCLMVGDRLDNDIAPASALGMATAWVRWPRRAAKGWATEDSEALQYRDSLERTSALASSLRPEIQPTWTVDELRHLDCIGDLLGP